MADPALLRLSLAEAADRIRRRALSPVALTEAVLAQIDALNPALNAFTTLVPREQVLAGARAAEREIAAGAYRGLLHGIPVSVKDLIDTAGPLPACSSRLFRDHAAQRAGAHARPPPAARALVPALAGLDRGRRPRPRGPAPDVVGGREVGVGGLGGGPTPAHRDRPPAGEVRAPCEPRPGRLGRRGGRRGRVGRPHHELVFRTPM